MANLKEIAIMVGIALLFTTLVIVTIDAVYEQPDYSTYCNESMYAKPIMANCGASYDPRQDECYREGLQPMFDVNESGCPVYTGCSDCSKRHQDDLKVYERNIFLIVGVIGVISVVFGTLYAIEFIGTGFMFSGIFLIFYATVRYFNEMEKWLRPIVIALELGLILWIAYKKLIPAKDKKQAMKRRQH